MKLKIIAMTKMKLKMKLNQNKYYIPKLKRSI
jgi:hypothetical protein